MCEQKCFFSNQELCSNDTMALYDLRYEEINKKCFPDAASLIEVLLLGDDRFYEHHLSLRSTFVCSVHKQELSKEYWPSSYRKCWLCVSLQKSPSRASERNINRFQAITIFEKFHIRHSYGKTICRHCRQSLTVHSDETNIENHEKAFEWIVDVTVSDSESCDDQSDDNYEMLQLNSSPNSQMQPIINLDKRKRELLNEFLNLCGSNKVIKTTKSYHQLQSQSKANFLGSTRHLIQHIIAFLAPNDSIDDVQQEVFTVNSGPNKTVYDRQLVPVMQGIAEAYANADNRSTRRSILSIVAPKIHFSILQSFIPGITYYRFIAARFHASQAESETLFQHTPRVVYRFDPLQVEHFVDFILSNYVCTDMPFGQQTLTLSNGTKLHVPDTIRNCNSSRIIAQYYEYATELFPGLSVLHESTLFKILTECKASTRRAVNGLNYFVANGTQAFDDISELINDLNLDVGEHRRLIDNIKRGKQYLKTDFKVNVARTSRVHDHCICFALSDPTSECFSTPCANHDHDQICSECSYLTQTLQDINQAVKVSINDNEEQQRKMYKFTLACDAIQAWKCHQLRSINQDLGRECVLDVLGEDALYLNLDFAMKWLPAKYREPQTEFFAKRGVSWHITVISRKKKQDLSSIDMINDVQAQDNTTINNQKQKFAENEDEEKSESSINSKTTDLNEFEHTVFVHVIDQCPQDSKLVVAIIDDILSRLKAYDPSISQACIRSDNAGCYHSVSTILSMPAISEKCGVAIRRWDFADPQGNKGSSDRFAAVLKSHVRRHLNEKHDVTNAEQFVEACRSYGGVKNVNVVECRFKSVHQPAKFQLNNIKQFRNFCFERYGIRVFRAWDIGEGLFLPYTKLIYGKVSINSLDLVRPSSAITFGASVNNSSPSIINANPNIKILESVNANIKLFECPEESCVCSFIKYGNLIRHLAAGNHRKMAEKLTLLDTAKKLYHSKLAAAENKKVISLSIEHVSFDSNNFDQLPELKVGWGLPVVRPTVRFTIKQKKFLDEKFNDGILYGRFWKPETVVSEMQQVKTSEGKYVFNLHEWLTTGQVRSYFSRMRSVTTQNIDRLSSSGGSQGTTLIDHEYEEEQDLDEEANAEESFKDDAAVQEAIERITFSRETEKVVGKATKEKRPLSSIQNEINTPKRPATPPQNRKY